MQVLSAAELLDVWERGRGQWSWQQALLLLGAACPDKTPEAVAELSIGQRDALLLQMREWFFGSRLNGVITCPVCGERLELAFTVGDIRVAPNGDPAETFRLQSEGYEVSFRLPNSLDLMTIDADKNDVNKRWALLARCLGQVQFDGKPVNPEQLPDTVIEAVIEHMAAADPQADVRLSLSCVACKHKWQALFDIISFLWAEIDAWAVRTLGEVHALARAYCWREADILAMSARRRQFYLEMANS